MKQLLNMMQGETFDNLYTPEIAVRIVEKYIPLLSGRTIWECCDPGNSTITKRLSTQYKVVSTDLVTGFDFLRNTPDFKFDAIITNPPFSLKDKFLKRCYQFGKPFALLLPIVALAGQRRVKLYKEYGISVIVIDSRIDYTGKGANWQNTSWFCGNGFTEDNSLYFEKMEYFK